MSVKISSWRRHDPNAVPTAAKGTGMYVNSSLAKVEALKAGYDEAILLASDGRRERVHRGEPLRRARRGALHPADLRRRCPRRASPRTPIETIAADLGYEVRHEQLIRTDLYLADEAFLTGTAAEVVPIRMVDDRPSARADPGRSPPRSSRRTSPRSAARWTATRTGSTMSTDHAHDHAPRAHGHAAGVARLRAAGAAGRGRHLRHDAARRQPAGGALAHRRRQAPGRRAARPPRGRLHRRAAGREPTRRTTSSSGARRTS